MLIIEPVNPLDPAPRALLEQSHALMSEMFEPEDNYYLGFDKLCGPEVHFITARDGGTVLAIGALVEMDGYCEVKSMFTAAAARGRGVAAAVLRALEDHARSLNAPMLRLETGDTLNSAIRLYERHGFVRCDRFGDYVPNDVSVYMQKTL